MSTTTTTTYRTLTDAEAKTLALRLVCDYMAMGDRLARTDVPGIGLDSFWVVQDYTEHYANMPIDGLLAAYDALDGEGVDVFERVTA